MYVCPSQASKMEPVLKDFLVAGGIHSATLECLTGEDVCTKDYFLALLPKHFDHLLGSNKVSVGQLTRLCYGDNGAPAADSG